MTDREFRGKTALVTGASRGIGRAVAIELARQGADVTLVARNLDRLTAVRKEAANEGVSAVIKSCDLNCEYALDELVKRLQEERAQIDILVNNAGVYSTDSIKPDDRGSGFDDGDSAWDGLWKSTLSVNLTAPYRLARALAPKMIERHWGRIVNISSISGKKAEVYGAAYSASKFALIGLTQALALELARHGVTVNSVCPGWVETDLAREQINDPEWCRLNHINIEESLDIARLSVPQMRFIQPDEVAALVGFLCSHRAKGITGQAINICGGLSIT